MSWFFPVSAITLWPFAFIRKGHDSAELVNHEAIHIRQFNETLVLGFFLIYVIDWLIGLIRYRSLFKAYMGIRMEREAYYYQDDPDYLNRRPRWAWLKLSASLLGRKNVEDSGDGSDVAVEEHHVPSGVDLGVQC